MTETSSGIGEVGLRPGLSAGAGFAIEFFITFALVLVVYAAAADEDNAASVKGSAPLAIGLAIAIGHLFAVCRPNFYMAFGYSWINFVNFCRCHRLEPA